VSVSGGTRAIAARLAEASLVGMDRRRRGEIEATDADDLALTKRAEALRELLRNTLQLPGDPPGPSSAVIS
jgi:hypothetical protein